MGVLRYAALYQLSVAGTNHHALRGCEPEKTFCLRQGGRSSSFSQKIYTRCNFFVKKIAHVHAAAGASAFYLVKRLACTSTA